MWVDKLENPEAISNVYTHPPVLEGVKLVSVSMDDNGPTVTLHFSPQDVPDKRSAKWERAGVNAVTIKLQLMAVEYMTIESWPPKEKVNIEINRSSVSAIQLLAYSTTMKLKCCCRFARISGVDGYRKGEF